jgi:hypothetical protein
MNEGTRIAGELTARRDEILWWEFCSLMHDIGKLSDEFLLYRQVWHALPEGYAKKDPHDDRWLERDSLLDKEEFKGLNTFFCKLLWTTDKNGPSGQISVENAVHNHMAPGDDNEFCQILNTADAVDSRYDRNSPLIGCEQTAHKAGVKVGELLRELPEIFRSNIFGHETAVRRGEVDKLPDGFFKKGHTHPKEDRPAFSSPGELHEARRDFYLELTRLLPLDSPTPHLCHRAYRLVRDLMRRSWDKGMSDTIRPDNDTSLWEHVYSVASIAKALHVKRIVRGTFKRFDPEAFRVGGLGFDSLRYLSFSHKMADVLARRKILDDIFDAATELVKYTVPCGNLIYRDASCAFFLVADVPKDLFDYLEREVTNRTLENSRYELLPSFASSQEAGTDLTCLPKLIEEIRETSAIPVNARPGASESLQAIHSQFEHDWKGRAEAICPVCGMRPAKRRSGVSAAKSVECTECIRRRSATKHFRNPEQTVFLSDIADGKGRVALVVARFGLRDWLNGKLVRTMFVTEPQGIKKTLLALESIPDLTKGPDWASGLEAWVKSRSGSPWTYEEMLEEHTRPDGSRSDHRRGGQR